MRNIDKVNPIFISKLSMAFDKLSPFIFSNWILHRLCKFHHLSFLFNSFAVLFLSRSSSFIVSANSLNFHKVIQHLFPGSFQGDFYKVTCQSSLFFKFSLDFHKVDQHLVLSSSPHDFHKVILLSSSNFSALILWSRQHLLFWDRVYHVTW